MAFRLQIKRGTLAPNNVLHIGELGYDTVAKKLYIGNGAGVAETSISMDGHKHSGGDINTGIVGVSYGGTGLGTYSVGEMLYASGTSVLSKLGIGSTNQILTVVGGVPAWANAGQAASVANSLVLKINTGTTEGTSLYTFNGSAAKTLDFVNGGGITLTAGANSVTIAHTDTSSAANLTANGRTYVTGLTFDTYGHVTGYTTGAETVVNTNTTYAVSAETVTGGANLRLTGSDAVTDDVKFASGANVTVTRTDANTITIASAHPTVSAASSSDNSGNTFIQDITLDGFGHVTALGTATVVETQLSKVDTGTGNVVTDVAVSNHQITVTKGITALTAEADTLDSVTTRGNTTTNDISVGNITTSGYLRGPATFTIDPAVYGNETGTVVIAGNLTVQGTTTTINSNTVSVGDSTILLNGDVTGTPTENAGIEVERGTLTNASILWNETSDRWTIVNPDATVVTVPSTTGTIALTSDLHARSHAMTSTSDHTAGNWKVFHSNGSGEVIELVLGAANTYLKSNGAAAAPTFGQIAYTEISGTPTIGNGALSLTTSAGLTNTAVTIGTGTGFTANATGASTYDIDVGPALTNLATFMTTATSGFIKRTAQDTYSIDTNSYALSNHTHTFLNLTDTPTGYASTDANRLVAVNATYNGLEFINELDCGTYAV